MNITKLMQGLVSCSIMAAGTANAGFIAMDAVPYASDNRSVASNNEFIDLLAGAGVTNYTLGTSLATDAAGSVAYYFYGKEAGYSNTFQAANGALSHSTGFSSYQNNFGSPVGIGSVTVGGGINVLDFGFCAFTAPAVSGGCLSNAQNDAMRYASSQSIAMSIVGDSAWLFWDDSGAGPDDDYDDMVIRAVFTPTAVPEPQTAGLLGIGLLGLWFAMRRRRQLIPTTLS